MVILIAESKTFQSELREISPSQLKERTPAGENKAATIMARIAGMPLSELGFLTKLKGKTLLRCHETAIEFPNKLTGLTAIEAYTGVVYKALDYPSLTSQSMNYAQKSLRIISSLYGWLRPENIIKDYRLDYTARVAPEDVSLAAYWKKDVTVSLVNYLKSAGENEILNLLPGDAAKTIDWKLVKNFAKVWKVDFKQLQPGGSFTTPTANRLKQLRGHLLRQILLKGISSPSALLEFATTELVPLGTPDYPDHIAFMTE
ncbi:MAG: YaaA family protein [Muribaculaceae bacterium]|nr:YaaA family protein [Muribaculaceae bacterium]